jgi:hypothetical protein
LFKSGYVSEIPFWENKCLYQGNPLVVVVVVVVVEIAGRTSGISGGAFLCDFVFGPMAARQKAEQHPNEKEPRNGAFRAVNEIPPFMTYCTVSDT